VTLTSQEPTLAKYNMVKAAYKIAQLRSRGSWVIRVDGYTTGMKVAAGRLTCMVLMLAAVLGFGAACLYWWKSLRERREVIPLRSSLAAPATPPFEPRDRAAILQLTARGVQVAGPPDPLVIQTAQDAAAKAAAKARQVATGQR